MPVSRGRAGEGGKARGGRAHAATLSVVLAAGFLLFAAPGAVVASEEHAVSVSSNPGIVGQGAAGSRDAGQSLPEPPQDPHAPLVIGELGAVPHLDQRGQLAFRRYAEAPGPKAFAISVTGAWGWWGEANSQVVAREEALRLCQRTSSVDCRLYALDGEIVWDKAIGAAGDGFVAARDARQRLLPPVSRTGQDRFREYLQKPDHKAFAVGADGVWDWWFGAWSRSLAEEEALARCDRRSSTACALFASGDEIVWKADSGSWASTLGDLPINADTYSLQGLRTGSYVDRRTCDEQADSVWALVDGVGFCIRYVAINADRLAGEALAYLHGDVHGVRLLDGKGFFLSNVSGYRGGTHEEHRNDIGRMARRGGAKLPLFALGRPGAFGSSGQHALISSTPDEWRIIDAALNALARRFGIDRWSLAGQSGGATLIASLIAVRRDIACAAMGSGAMGQRSNGSTITDTLSLARRFEPAPELRIFVLGDPRDKQVSFDSQKTYHRTLTEAGIAARLIELEASDPLHHGLGDRAIQVADLCARGLSDGELEDRLGIESN